MPLRRSAPLEIGLEIEAGLEIADLDLERDLEAEIEIGPPAPLEIDLEIERGLEVELAVPVTPTRALAARGVRRPAAHCAAPCTTLRPPPASHRKSNPKPTQPNPNPALTNLTRVT